MVRWPSAILAATLLFSTVGAAESDPLDRCDTRVRDAPRDPGSTYCYLEAVRSGAPIDEAIRRLDAILATRPEMHRARMILGMIENLQGSPRTESLLREAVAGMEETEDHHGVVYGGLDLAYFLGNQNRLDEAEAMIVQAAQAAEVTGDDDLKVNVWTEQALMATRRADYGRALHLFRKAEALVFPDGPAWSQAHVVSGLGWLHWYFGEHSRAMASYRREAEIWEASGNRLGVVSPLANLAFLALERAGRGEFRLEDCGPLIDEALSAALASGDRSIEAQARLMRARVLPPEEAIAELRQTIRLIDQLGAVDMRWAAQGLLAFRTLDLGPEHTRAAFVLVDTALQEARRSGTPENLSIALQNRATLMTRAGSREAAVEAWEACIAAVGSIEELQAEDTVRAYTLSHWSFPYQRVIDLLLGGMNGSADPDADLEKAFRTMESMRARSLVEFLGRRESAAGRENPLTLAETRATLDEGEVILAWQVVFKNSGGSWLVAISRDRVQLRQMPRREDLEDAVAMFEGLLRDDDRLTATAAADLYSMVFDDVLEGASDRIQTLILVPDGPLHRLPFAALRQTPDAEPLGTRMRIDVVPSVALWSHWRSAPLLENEGTVLALADPDIPSAAVVEAFRQDGRPGVLTYARGEARAMARSLGGVGRILTGTDASESALKTIDPASYRVLHLATHAVVDDARPERSAVLLAAGGDVEDGLLQVGEIARLELNGHVVILSSCRGASGPVVGGEGVLGLARAFLAAGAGTVVANRWPYRDDDAAALTKAIAEELGTGASVGEALTAARRSRVAAGAPATAWAGVTLIGDGSAVPVPGGRRTDRGLLSFAFAVVVLGVCLLAWILVRRRRSATG